MNVWCINCQTGDKYTNRKWSDYYNPEECTNGTGPKFGYFQVGTIIGILVDIDRGIVHFYKDGNDLGQAFVDKEVKRGYLFPFVQVQTRCKVSIFHPYVYPMYRAPIECEEEE